MRTSNPGPMENIVEGLDEQTALLSSEELKSELRERGIDIDGFLTRSKSLIASHQKAERTSWMKIADTKREILAAARESITSWAGRREEEILAAFEALSTGPNAVAFRNKGDISVKEMAQILDDCERLKVRNKTSDSE